MPNAGDPSDNTARLTTTPPTPSTKRLFGSVAPRALASLLIGAGFLWLLMRGGLPLLPPPGALGRLPWWGVSGYLALLLLATFLRTSRWIYLLRAIAPDARPLRVFGMGLVGFSAVFLAPLRSGELVRPYLIARDGKVSFLQATGTVAAERIIDGLVLTCFTFAAISLAVPLSPLPDALGDLPLPVASLPAIVYSALLVFAGAFAGMTLFYVARERARRITQFVVGLVSERGADWAAGVLERLADGLRFLPARANILPFVRDTAGYWLLSIASQWVLLRGVGLPASLSQAVTTVGILGLGTLVPAGPGMFGAYQVAGFSALAMFFSMGQVRSEGAVFLFVTYTAQLVLNGLQLGLGFWLMARVPARPAAA